MGSYTQLTQDKRYQIYAFIKAGFSQTSIAAEIGVHKSKVSRELSRNRGQKGYRPKQAHRLTLERRAEGRKRQTKRTRYFHLLAFFNFIKNNLDQDFRNPCNTPMLKKLFRAKPSYHWNIIEKETVDEVIFRTAKPRNRLMLELMARGGMRIGEVLKLTPSDIHDRRRTLRDPKSGREQEFIFIPQRLAGRLKDYIREKGIEPNQRFSGYVIRRYLCVSAHFSSK